MIYTLYNSLSNNKIEPEYIKNLKTQNDENNKIIDAVKTDYKEFFASLKEGDIVDLVGGDGTINYLINAVEEDEIKNDIYIIPTGTGNDFYHDATNSPKTEESTKEKLLLNPYLKNLPTVTVNGITRKFINGVGFGIDGYCCEVGDNLKEKSDKKVNYTSIAIKGLLFHFKPVKSTIEIDGKTYEYKNVWLTPTMKGRYYGGGMMVAPNQNRFEEGVVSTVVYKSRSKLKALIVFPSIFKGEHIKKEKVVKIFTGKNVKVTFDKPTALQIDGETVKNVLSYSVRG